jgi:peptide/nickel transport system permease protein
MSVDESGPTGNIEIEVEAEAPMEHVQKKKLGFGFWVSIGWLVVIVGLAALAPILPLKDPDTNFVVFEVRENNITGRVSEQPVQPPYSPSGEHWFGTDQDARDIFSRTIYGARVSLTVGFAAIAFGFVFGGSFGMIAGFVRGWFDRVVSFVFLVLLSFPALVLAILITALVDRSLFTISLTLGILSIAPVGRLARAQTMVFAEREFVMAARTIGAKRSRILLRELLPNVLIPMAALALLGMAVAIVAEGGLAFLGLSIEKGSTWGKLIRTYTATSADLEDSPWMAFTPIGCLFFTVVALNYAGDKLRDYLDVKELAL